MNAIDTQQFLQMQDQVRQHPVWRYPYPELINDLKNKGQHSILIFSYGSLMDVKSASQTLSPDTLKTRRPAIAYGVRRVFDRDVPVKPQSTWCQPNHPKARGMLNVLPTHFSEDFINGVLIDVTLNDISKVLVREEGYDLMPVIVQDWNSVAQTNQASYQVAYTFHAPQDSAFTNNSIMPRPGYYELTRDAAAQFGPLYALMWFKTTYLSDGHTPINTWERLVKNASPETQVVCP